MRAHMLTWIPILLFSSVGFLTSNPLPIPQAFISEFTFGNNGKWQLEISFQFSTWYRQQDYDSICLGSSQGNSRIRLEYVRDSTLLLVITSDSLVFPLAINSEGDCIKLYSYVSIVPEGDVDSLPFGNYPGSAIGDLRSGYSISRYSYTIFCKDKSPTIGTENDTAGICGTLNGYIYDKNNATITSGDFRLDYPLMLNGNGTYSTTILARKIVQNMIQRYYRPFTSKFEFIDTLSLDMNPDSVITKDIHFKDYVAGVKRDRDTPGFELNVMNYPNPFNSSTIFIVRIPDKLKYKAGFINIYNINGEEIFTVPLTSSSSVRWDGKNKQGQTVSSGVYYYRLLLDAEAYKSGSMIFLK